MKTTRWLIALPVTILVVVIVLLPKPKDDGIQPVSIVESPTDVVTASPIPTVKTPDIQFTLQTIAEGGKLLFQGMGGEIDGVVNPDLILKPGAVVKIVLINADGMPHNLYLPDFDAESSYVAKIGDRAEIIFEVGDRLPGSFVYYCEVPGHRQAGQEGKLIVQYGSE